jgi:Fe2+ or Zn2+ uptake regulation protein
MTAVAVASDAHEVAAERLGRLGQRYTAGRRALVDVLVGADAPLTILEIVAGGRALAQSSAYRNLTVLEQAGVVGRITSGQEHARFELAHDLTGHHHHLICSTCGIVRDFTVSDGLEQQLELTMRQTAELNDFDVELHRLDIVGVCAACR